MYSFKELRKNAKRNVDGQEIKIAVLGNCSTQFFATAVTGYARLSDLNVTVFDTAYDQIEMQLLDENSEIYHSQTDMILLWFATNKLYEEFLDTPRERKSEFAERYIDKITYDWNLIRKHTDAKILQMNFTEWNDKLLGQYSAKTEITFIYQIRKLNFLLQEAMSKDGNVYPVDILSEQIRLGQAFFYDASYYYRAKMSVSFGALPYVAKAVVDVIKSMSGRIKKCAVLDLDNTLWGGTIGDDGIGGIEIGGLGRGHAFTNLQKWIRELKECGVLLAVCSKNNEKTAKQPFEKHEEMILRLDDISVFVANWADKASNIKFIQKSLNIGMDSIVLIDDNPFERNLVKTLLPEVEVPNLPEDAAEYLEFLQNENYFDTVTFEKDSSDRTEQYRAEFERKKTEHNFKSVEEYLKSLEMKGEGQCFDKEHAARIAQLTQRSNQFNLRTIRYTEEEICRIVEEEGVRGIYYTLNDKFGNHGVIGVIILRIGDEDAFLDTWLMSCRVLQRGMEEFMMNHLVKNAREQGLQRITAEYIPTPKNEMVKELCRRMGFRETYENHYELNLKEYQIKTTYIGEHTHEAERNI